MEECEGGRGDGGLGACRVTAGMVKNYDDDEASLDCCGKTHAHNATYESQAKVRARSIYVGDYGPLGNSDDSATINAAYAAGTGREIVFPANAELHVNGTLAENVSHATINGNGSTLVLNPLGVQNLGIALKGVNEDLSIYRMRVQGNGNVADGMGGIGGGNGSGNIRRNVRVIDCTIKETTLGISISADTSGVLEGLLFQGNHIRNIHGTSGGFGYGLHWAAKDTVNSTNIRCIGNVIDGAQRHSIYASMAVGVVILGNQIVNHRNQYPDSSTILPAVAIARSTDVEMMGNVISKSAGGSLLLGGPYPQTTARGYTVLGNSFIDSVGAASNVLIGQQAPATEGVPIGIDFAHNLLRSSQNTPMLNLWNGKDVRLTRNTFHRYNQAGTSNHLSISGLGNTGNDMLDDISIENNTFRVDPIDGTPVSTGAIRFSPGVDASTSRIRFRGNTKSNPGNFFILSTPLTNPNVDVQDQDASGLVWTGGAAPVAARMRGAAGTTAPAAGAASAPPATPAGYLTVEVNGTQRKVAYY